jgi:hypothetical protein
VPKICYHYLHSQILFYANIKHENSKSTFNLAKISLIQMGTVMMLKEKELLSMLNKLIAMPLRHTRSGGVAPQVMTLALYGSERLASRSDRFTQ